MQFYRDVFGGELAMNTFSEFGQTGPEADQIMHAQLDTPAGYTFMGSDTPPGMDYVRGAARHADPLRRGRGRTAPLLGRAR